MRVLKSTFKRIRKRNLIIFLITPTFFDFNKYFSIFRTRFLVHIHARGLKRGFFRFFGMKRKKMLYLNGKEKWNMNAALPNFRGRFTNLPKGLPINFSDGGEYDVKKDIATAALNKKTKERTNPKTLKKNVEANDMKKVKAYFKTKLDKDLSNRELGIIFGRHHKTVGENLEKKNEISKVGSGELGGSL